MGFPDTQGIVGDVIATIRTSEDPLSGEVIMSTLQIVVSSNSLVHALQVVFWCFVVVWVLLLCFYDEYL